MCLQGSFSPKSVSVHIVCLCVAPGTALRVILFAKAVCAGVLKLLGHQALIQASRVTVRHLVIKQNALFTEGTRESCSCLGCVLGWSVASCEGTLCTLQPSAWLSTVSCGDQSA